MPKVSILMPAYNAEKYINEAIDCIIKQTYTDFELIIYNDGSNDKTAKIIKSYKDKRIKFIDNKKNLGCSTARTELLKNATGKYITWMDADDTCDLNRIEKQVEFLDNNDDYVFCGTGYKLQVGNIYINRFLFSSDKNLRFYPAFCGASVMFRKSALKGIDIKSVNNGGEDYALLLQLIKKGNVENLTDVKYYYRQDNPNSVSKNPIALKNILTAFVKYRTGKDISPVKALKQLPISKGLCIAVWYIMANGFKGLPVKYIIPTVLFGLWWKLMHKVSR